MKESVVVVLVMFLVLGRLTVLVTTASVSCSLGGDAACKWSCRLRGYIRGDCQGDGGGGTHCSCTLVSSSYLSVIDH